MVKKISVGKLVREETRQVELKEGDLVLLVRNRSKFAWSGKTVGDRRYVPIETKAQYVLGIFNEYERQTHGEIEKIHLKPAVCIEERITLGNITLPHFRPYKIGVSTRTSVLNNGKYQIFVGKEIPLKLEEFGLKIYADLLKDI